MTFDDFPVDAERFFRVVDGLKERFPNFKCTAFAVPAWMYESKPCKHEIARIGEAERESAWRNLDARKEWIRVGVHGFRHLKRETRLPDIYLEHRGWLDKLDDRWSKVFKGPWYGYCHPLLEDLHKRGYVTCSQALYGYPMPMPADWRMWNVSNARIAEYSMRDALGLDTDCPGNHIVSHPVWPVNSRGRRRSKSTEISDKKIRKWSAHWHADDEWSFVGDLARSALLKLNLGCEDQVWNGWDCLDNRAQQLNNGSLFWDFSRMLPYADNKADVIFSGHTFEYIAEENYVDVLLECWRVLRPDGVLRLSQLDGHAWRQPGQSSRGTGEIKSVPTKAKIYEALRKIGFEVHEARPGQTASHHKDVLQGDSRERLWRRGRKFYCEAMKRLPQTFDISRPRGKERLPGDCRATKSGRYRLPEQETIE